MSLVFYLFQQGKAFSPTMRPRSTSCETTIEMRELTGDVEKRECKLRRSKPVARRDSTKYDQIIRRDHSTDVTGGNSSQSSESKDDRENKENPELEEDDEELGQLLVRPPAEWRVLRPLHYNN